MAKFPGTLSGVSQIPALAPVFSTFSQMICHLQGGSGTINQAEENSLVSCFTSDLMKLLKGDNNIASKQFNAIEMTTNPEELHDFLILRKIVQAPVLLIIGSAIRTLNQKNCYVFQASINSISIPISPISAKMSLLR